MLAGLVLAALLPSGAVAAPDGEQPRSIKLTLASASVPGVSGSRATAIATCPKKTKVVAGAFSTSPTPGVGGMNGFVYESRRVTTRQWQVSFMQGSSVAGTLNAQAFCERGIRRVTEVFQAAPIGAGANAFTAVEPTCPGKRKVVSGGWFIGEDRPSFTFSIPIDSLASTPQSWRFEAARINGTTPIDALGYAYCAKKERRTALAAAMGPTTAINQYGAAASPPCGGRKRLAAIGFDNAASAVSGGALWIHEVAPLDNRTGRVAGIQLGGTPPQITVTGYCLKR